MKCIETEYIKSLLGLFTRMKVEGSGLKVQGSGLAQGACRPLIERKRFSGFCRFYGFKGVGAAQIIMKRREYIWGDARLRR